MNTDLARSFEDMTSQTRSVSARVLLLFMVYILTAFEVEHLSVAFIRDG